MKNYTLAQEWSQGNEGALAFLAQLDQVEDSETLDIIETTLLQNPFLRGPRLYRLWDLCGKNMDQFRQICFLCPPHLLEQFTAINGDGENLIKPYLKPRLWKYL